MTYVSREASKHCTKSPTNWLLSFFSIFYVTIRSTSPDMATVFHARPYGRFIEIKSNFRRRKLQLSFPGPEEAPAAFRSPLNH